VRKLLIALCACAAFIPTAHADSPSFEPTGPSFNCNYAKTPDEVVICQDPELSTKDREMASVYFQMVNASRGDFRIFLRRSQAA
jgi:uncharacterized protein